MLDKKIFSLLLLLLTSTRFMVLGVFHRNNMHISYNHRKHLELQHHNKTNISHVPTHHRPVDNKYGPFFMTMPLDHFNDENESSFQNRYWINTDYYKKNGPIILYNVGEAAADRSDYLVIQSSMAQLAELLHGIIIVMEHRFYGASSPNAETFFDNTPEDLQTFNHEQALADMAYLIQKIKFHNVNAPSVPKTKAIIYGCSYSGALSAWARKEYPNVFFASVASSAPVQAIIDFYQYFDPIIRYGPKACIKSLENVISYVDNILFHGTDAQVEALKKIFYAERLSDQSFAQLLTGSIGGDWQYGIDFDHNDFKEKVCSCFSKRSQSNVRADAISYAKYINNFTRQNYCSSKSEGLEDCLYESSFTVTDDVSHVSNDEAGWTWQTCNEFGFNQVSPPNNLPSIVSRKFGLDYAANVCQQYFSRYGVPVWPDVDVINNQYQGWNIQLNRTLWIDGEWDSWRELSVNSPDVHRDFTQDNSSTSIIIPKSTHCANVAEVTDSSPKYLKNILQQQYNTLRVWLESESY